MTWKLQAITGEFTGQEIVVDHDMLVGRHQDADLVLQAAEVSRKHAALLLRDDQLWVQDLNSSNGTFVNDLRIEQEVQLHDADIVQFAGLKFSVLPPSQAVDKNINNAELNGAEIVNQHTEILDQQVLKTPAQQLDDGMLDRSERAQQSVTREGMPKTVEVPKPAPIAQESNISIKDDPGPEVIPDPVSRNDYSSEPRKNTMVGLMTILGLILVAILMWMFFS